MLTCFSGVSDGWRGGESVFGRWWRGTGEKNEFRWRIGLINCHIKTIDLLQGMQGLAAISRSISSD